MLTYVKGDVLEYPCCNNRIIPHVCNNKGGWGSGFVVALSRKWKEPEKKYRALEKYKLGDVQFVQVDGDTLVANMVAQDGFASSLRPVALDYRALSICMDKVRDAAYHRMATITAPRFGSGLAGGDWGRIEILINRVWEDLDVVVCDL